MKTTRATTRTNRFGPGKKGITRKEYERLRKAKEDEERVRQNRMRLEREQAKERWVEEWLMPADEFTMEAYQEFLEDESNMEEVQERVEEREKLLAKYFGNQLVEKEEKARRSITLRKVVREANRLWGGAKKEMAKLGHEALALLEPYEKKVERRVTESLRRIVATDKETEDFLARRQRMLDLLDQQKKRAKIETKKRKVALEVREITTAVVKRDEDRLRQELRQKRVEQFKAQVKAEAEARMQARRDSDEAKVKETAEDILKVRKWRLRHWTKVAAESRIEARELKVAQMREAKSRLEEAMELDRSEDEGRVLDRQEEQAVAPATSAGAVLPSGDRLGVFGIPVGEGDYLGFCGGGHKAGVDDTPVQLFQPTQQYAHERKVWSLWESQAEEERKRLLYNQLQNESKMLGEQVESLAETKRRLERDLAQTRQEEQFLLHNLDKPQQRYPDLAEKNEMHARKQRLRVMEEHVASIDKESSEAAGRKRDMDAQALSLAKELALLKEKNKALAEQHDNDMHGGGRIPEMPVVVGRSIAKIPEIGEFVGRPQESYNLVVQQSKLEVYKEQSKAVFKAQREAINYDMKVWMSNEEKRMNKEVMQELMSRLKDAQDRVKAQANENKKQDLVTALQLFFSSRERLHVVDHELRGGVAWWMHQSEKDCRNMEQFWSSEEAREDHDKGTLTGSSKVDDSDPEAESKRNRNPAMQGVALKGGSKTGVCVGQIEFPKLDLWTVQFLVTKREPRNKEQGSKIDYVSIRLGPSVKNLTFVGTYYNVMNEDTLSIQYEISYQIKSKTLAYRFEFSSDTEEADQHMVVLPAAYVNKPLEDLEAADGNRVVSALVKYLRVDMAKGCLRSERLLEELVSAEAVSPDKTPYWDSDVLIGYAQRYLLHDFVHKARTELRKMRDEELQKNVKPVLANRELTKLTGNEKRELRSLRSRNAYIKRKRLQHQETVDAARMLKNRHLSVYMEERREWEHIKVLDVRVKWRDQVEPHVAFLVQAFNEWAEPVGEPHLRDLSRSRFHDMGNEPERDEEAYKLFCEQREKQAEVEADQKRNEDKRRAEKELAEHIQEQGMRELERVRRKKMEDAKKQIEAEANRKLKEDEVFIEKMEVHVLAVMEEMKQGLLLDSEGQPYARPIDSVARDEAYRRWKVDYVAKMVAKTEEELLYQESVQREKMEHRLRKMEKKRLKKEAKQAKLAAYLASEQEKLRNQRLNELAQERLAMLKQVLQIPNFHKAVTGGPDWPFCEHLKAKAWGSLYGRGLRCHRCHKELTTTFDDPSQQHGIGYGEDPELVGLVARHRLNSPAFRFRSAEELRRVEEERRRLEKERREMKEVESTFYDLEDMKVIYEFDRRHKNYFKQEGIFRQGVQWTEWEALQWKRKEQEYLDSLTPRTRAKKKQELDDVLYERQPPPTLRHYDMVRHALHQEMMYSFARVSNCRTRITELKSMRVTILVRRKEAGAQAEYIHDKLIRLEAQLRRYERTLDETDRIIERRKRADRDWRNAKALIVAADIDQKEAEMACVGLDDIVASADRTLALRMSEVMVLLRQKIIMEREAKRLKGNSDMLRARSKSLHTEMEEQQEKVDSMQYHKKGAVIPTPYGKGSMGVVWHYRHEDDMVLLRMPFGKVYMPPSRSVLIDRARQQAARVEMEVEEQAARVYYRHEAEVRKREVAGMAEEEHLAMMVAKVEREDAEHERLIEDAVKEEEATILAAFQTPGGMAAIHEKADKLVAEAVNKRLVERRAYEGPASERPHVLSRQEKEQLHAKVVLKLKTDYLSDHLLVRKQVTRTMLEAKRRDKAELEALSSTFEGLVHDLIVEVVTEEVQIGLETRIRSEGESGIVFLDPPHMMYGIYKSLKARWMERRDYLRSSIDLFMTKASKSKEEFQAEADKARILNESLEARAQREAEEKRQADLNAEMAAEEAALRTFYREEFLGNLKERRLMAEEERVMRIYLTMLERAEEAAKAEGGGVVGGAAVDKPSLSRNEMRRLELKKTAVNRIREEKEGLQMMQEDEAAYQLRSYHKMLEQREKLMAEGGMVIVDDDDDDDDEDDESVQLDEDEDAEVIPNIPLRIEAFTEEEQEEMLGTGHSMDEVATSKKERAKQIRWRRRRVRVMVESNRKRKAAERSAAAKWNMLFESSLVKCMKAELAWMEAEEEDRCIAFELRTVEENHRKLSNLAQRKGIEEVRARQDLRTKQQYRDESFKTRDDAVLWAAKCREHEEKQRLIRLRVTQDTRYKDTDVIMGFYQRWSTEELSKRLYMDYFRTLATILVTRSEAVGLERRLMKMQDYLVQNLEEVHTKQAMLKTLDASLRRKMMRKWRRSELGTKMFSKTRRHTLVRFFQGWVRYTLWQQGFQKAFDLKYTMIKHELDLRRLYPETRTAAERAEHLTTTEEQEQEEEQGQEESKGAPARQRPAGAGGESGEPHVKRTLLMRHKMRPLRCRNCRAFFIEDQNQDTACAFHPGEYKIACPRSCPGLSTKCMSHRMKRWTCCDNREEGTHMHNGCRTRRHMAVPDSTPYKAIELAAKAAYDARDEKLTSELAELSEHEWPRQLLTNAREQLKAVEEDLAAQRQTVARYDRLKFV